MGILSNQRAAFSPPVTHPPPPATPADARPITPSYYDMRAMQARAVVRNARALSMMPFPLLATVLLR